MSGFNSFVNGTTNSGQPLSQNRAPLNQPISYAIPGRATPARTLSPNLIRNQPFFSGRRGQQSLASKCSMIKRQNWFKWWSL